MAVTCLSPWPAAGTAKLTAAAAYIRKRISGSLDDDDILCGVGEAVAALIEREAPGAPQAVKNEAAIRCLGYLAESDFGALRSEEIGPLKQEFTADHSRAFRRSGAKGLLAPWKVRRAGAIAG